jgi:ubiquinone/menaquinone biosynthesis C-methylase UbiE
LWGKTGKVYAVDIHEMSIRRVNERIKKHGIQNVESILAEGYHSGVPDHVADAVAATGMFQLVPRPTVFLEEAHRITKKDGFLIIDDGHQSREKTKVRLAQSDLWHIEDETPDHMKCRPA